MFTVTALPFRLGRYRRLASRIVARSETPQVKDLSDHELRQAGHDVRWRAQTGSPPRSLLPETFALVREAARRTLGQPHFPVQIMGGIALFDGHVAEMQTGEGKTLTATLPATLRALMGRGCHVVTVNDYLAQRDSRLMGPVYAALGLQVGCVTADMSTDARRTAYERDVTYGTAQEFGFDFLRDRLRLGATPLDREPTAVRTGDDAPVQRGHYFALLDEADSVLIDEARTPLIIALTQTNDAAAVSLLRWCDRVIERLAPATDFVYESDCRLAFLTDAGCRKVLLTAKPSLLDPVNTERLYGGVENALTARLAFRRDRDYVVHDHAVAIVDESTGRVLDGRKWQGGLHQAIEAKEQLPITAQTSQAARITVQRYFRQYEHIAGTTGTAMQVRRELRATFAVSVTPIPTHRRCLRKGQRPRVFSTLDAKRSAVVREIGSLHAAGRAVLVGTPSVEASEKLGALLQQTGIPHQILNARLHAAEAEIVAQAGQPGRVTIATNMAGRGTDIALTSDVQRRGGLHVIATEMHSSARIDRQLIGRAARQGDPGSFQFFLSLEDELLLCRPPEELDSLRRRAKPDATGELSASWVRVFRRVQRFLETTHVAQRRRLLQQEEQRQEDYRRMGLDPYLELTE